MSKIQKVIFAVSIIVNIILIITFVIIGKEYSVAKANFKATEDSISITKEEMKKLQEEYEEYKLNHK